MKKNVFVASGLCVIVLGACTPESTSKDMTKATPSTGRPAPASPKQPPGSDSLSANAPRSDDGNDIASMLASDAAEFPKRLEQMRAAPATAPVLKSGPSPAAKVHWNDGPPESNPNPAPPIKATKQPEVAAVKTSLRQPALAPPSTSNAIGHSPPVANVKAMAISDSFSETAAKDTDNARPVARAMSEAALAIGDPQRAFDAASFARLNAEERELVNRFHDACVTLGRDLAAGKPAAEAAQALTAISNAAAEQTTISIPRIELCTRVEGFGKVASLDNRRFLPGKSTQVILYTEIDNFTSEREEKSAEWTTSLSTKVTIFAKHDGTQVWSREWQKVSDKSAAKRDDFFICEKVTLSDFLTVGTYLMRAAVRDEKTGALAEKSIEFAIVADPAIAAK